MTIQIETMNLPRFGLLRQTILAHSIFLIPLVFYCVANELSHVFHPEIGPPHFVSGFGKLFLGLFQLLFLLLIPILLMGRAILRFYHMVRYVNPDNPFLWLFHDLKNFISVRARLAQGIPALLIVACVAFIFADVQSNILTLQPATWDQTFANWDQAVHFGKHPWQWLQPIIGYAPITFLLNFNYNMWFFSMMFLLLYFGFTKVPSMDRTRFLIGFIGIWIVSGTILALIFSSAGPCYYGRLGLSPDPYAEQMAYLRHVNESFPLWALRLQDSLWLGHLNNVEGSVVSAMPSLHNGSALLFALAGYKINKLCGRILSVHAALIFIGSFHLAWHYAIDSYLAWAVTLMIWYASAPIAKWWHEKSAQKDFDAAVLI